MRCEVRRGDVATAAGMVVESGNVDCDACEAPLLGSKAVASSRFCAFGRQLVGNDRGRTW